MRMQRSGSNLSVAPSWTQQQDGKSAKLKARSPSRSKDLVGDEEEDEEQGSGLGHLDIAPSWMSSDGDGKSAKLRKHVKTKAELEQEKRDLALLREAEKEGRMHHGHLAAWVVFEVTPRTCHPEHRHTLHYTRSHTRSLLSRLVRSMPRSCRFSHSDGGSCGGDRCGQQRRDHCR